MHVLSLYSSSVFHCISLSSLFWSFRWPQPYFNFHFHVIRRNSPKFPSVMHTFFLSSFPRCSRSLHPSLVFHHDCESRLSTLPLSSADFLLSPALIVLRSSVPLLRFAHSFAKSYHSRFSPACLPWLNSSGLLACPQTYLLYRHSHVTLKPSSVSPLRSSDIATTTATILQPGQVSVGIRCF